MCSQKILVTETVLYVIMFPNPNSVADGLFELVAYFINTMHCILQHKHGMAATLFLVKYSDRFLVYVACQI